MSRLPIADYALLSDCRSAALVGRNGSIDWLCFPRFDGPSVFGRLLDDAAGLWSIRPVGATHYETSRQYVHDTLVLETTFTTAGGSVTLTDALAVGRNERGHGVGAGAVGALLRRVSGSRGRSTWSWCTSRGPSTASSRRCWKWWRAASPRAAGPCVLALSSSVPLDTDESTAHARFTVGAGEAQSFALHHRSTSQEPPPPLERDGDPRSARRHRGGVADVVEPAPGLRRPVDRPGAARAVECCTG